MSIATLQDIITKFRRLTISGTSNQVTDARIIDYINSFYLYDFPAEYRSLKLQDLYYFNTIAGIDVYPFDSEHYTTVQQPCYCMNREIKLFQDPWGFYGVNYNWQFQENFTQGDGSAGEYTGTLNNFPIIRSYNNVPAVTKVTYSNNAYSIPKPSFPQSNVARVQNLLITANTVTTTLHVTDDGQGNLIGDVDATGVNTINYNTGAISVKFSSAVPSGNNIQAQYNPQKQSIPLSILFFQNSFTLRPVPDKGYTIQLVAYRMPSQAMLGSTDPNTPNMSGTPELNEWWETIAFGAAKKFYEDQLDNDGVNLMEAGLQKRYQLNETRTYAQLGKQRTNTIYADQLSANYGSGGWGIGTGTS